MIEQVLGGVGVVRVGSALLPRGDGFSAANAVNGAADGIRGDQLSPWGRPTGAGQAVEAVRRATTHPVCGERAQRALHLALSGRARDSNAATAVMLLQISVGQRAPVQLGEGR